MTKTLFDLSILAGKSTVVLLYLFLFYRFLGKRQLAQFNLYDLVTIMAVANSVQNAMTTGKGDLSVGFVCAGTLLICAWVITRGVVRAPIAHRILYGTPTILLSNGQIIEGRMAREHVTEEELSTAIRQHGLVNHADVFLAVLEVDGTISIIPQANSSK